MLRRIIEIDQSKCNGCGICVNACHEGAIELIDGVATLMKEDYCDGLGDCLPNCPKGAIHFIEKDTVAYDEQAVKENLKRKKQEMKEKEFQGCPGSRVHFMNRTDRKEQVDSSKIQQPEGSVCFIPKSQLSNWPVQIKLAPVNAPYFDKANIVVAADCTAYAYANMHQEFMRNHVTLIGCPKLDMVDYTEKLTQILKNNSVKSVTCIRMEVPCCGGLEMAVKNALQNSGKMIPWQVKIVSIGGELME